MVRQDPPRSNGAAVGGGSAPTPLDWRHVADMVSRQTLGRRVVYLESTTSTNDVARDLGQAGEPEGVVVVADGQTAGRGRAGKAPWLTPPGTSIAVSVLLRPALAPEHLSRLALVAGVAAVDAVREATGVSAMLKWPNDVMVAERKLGGILVESRLRGSAVAFVVLGIGINGNVPAGALGPLPDAAVPATSLQDEAGAAVSREAVLVALLRHLDRRYAAIGDEKHVGGLREAYRARLSTLGRAVRIVGAAAPVAGIAEDIAADGALVVRLPNGERRSFVYGEVTVRG